MKAPIELIMAKFNSFAAGFFLLIPNIIAAVIFLAIFWVIARIARGAIIRVAHHRGRPDLGNLLGSLAHGAVLLLAFLFAAAIVFPSVNPGGIFATLGVGSVAIGFAFKDILQNLLAGLLLLINRPYRRGDQIKIKEFEGTVEHIESRATLIKTYDGRRVIIPNSDVYTSPVVVNTAFPTAVTNIRSASAMATAPRRRRRPSSPRSPASTASSPIRRPRCCRGNWRTRPSTCWRGGGPIRGARASSGRAPP